MPYTKKPVASRILSKYEQERAYRLHRQKVSSVRHGIDNSPPKRYPHLLLRLKQIQKEEEKMAEVDHENKLLLQKMTQIMRTHGRIDNWNMEHEPRSLNYPYKHKQLEKIAEENINIARRLETVQPIYSKEEWEEEYQQRRYLMDLWAYSTKDYDDTPRGKYKRSKGEDSDGKYDSDFESDDDAKSSKLPSIDESDKKSDTKKESQKKSKDESHTKLPKINEKKKESLGLDHTYEMYWGNRYDPDGNKENSKGKSDKDDNEAVQEGKKLEKDNAKGKKDREDDKNKDDKKDDNKKKDGKKDDKNDAKKKDGTKDDKNDAKKKDGTKEEKKDDKKGTDKKGNETKEQGNNNARKGSKDEEHSKSKNKADMTPVEADCKQLFKVAKEMAAPDDILIKTLVKKSPSYRQQVQRKFQEMYDLDLSKELKQGLGSDWNLLIDELLADPTEGDAGALHTALEKNNIPTVVEILCSNQSSLAQVKEAYRKEFAVSLESDVANKTKEPVNLLLMTLLKEGRDESTDVDDKRVEKDTTVLHEFGDGRWSNKSGKFLSLLEEKSLAHIKAVLKMYKSVSGGKEVLHSVKEECDQEYADAVGAFVSTVRSSSDTYAEKLYKNINATNPVFVKTLVARAEIDMPSVRKAYKKKYDAELTEDIEDRCSHPTVKLLKELASKTPAKKSKGNKKYAGMALAPPPKGKPLKRPENKSKDDDSSQNPLNSKRGGEGSKQKKDDKDDEKAPKTTGTITPAKNFDALKEVEKLHKAMDGFGTDEQVIIDVISNKSNEQRQLLKKKYKEKYKKDLMKDLESELRGDFEELVLALMMEPTEYDAHCIHEAVKGPGTCEGTLIGILCTRSGKDIKAIKEHYRRAYTSDLENDIRSDTSGEFEELLVQLLKGGRDSGWEVNQKEAEDDAKALNKDKSIKVSDETFKRVMTKKNRSQAKATFAEYKKLSDQEIVAAIAASGDAKDGYEGLAKALEDPIKFYAARLHEGFKGLGTNDTQLIRILVSRSEIDLADIKAKYAELYGKTLKEKVEAECSGHYKRTLLTILGENNDSSKDDKAKAKNEKKKAGEKSEKKSVYLNNGPSTKENAKNTKGNKIKSKSEKSIDEKKKSGSKTPMLAERRSPDGQSDEINDKKTKEKDEAKEDNAWETMEPTGTIKAATDFKPEEQCKILYNAMDGIGTDEEAIITVLTSCNNSQRQQLKKTYKKTYKKELMAHLKGELTGDLEETVVLLLMEPTEFAVEGMHRAMDGVGTDERLLLYASLVHSTTAQDLKSLCKKYKEAHKKDLSKAVSSETSGLIQKVLLNILAGKRSQTTQVKEKDVEESAKKLYGDGENAFKYDVEYCADLLTTLSPSQAKAVFSRYKELSGEDVTKSIEKHMAGYPEMACLSVARYLQSPYLYTAHVLHEATSGTGTNDNLLMAVIVGRSEIDLVNIMMAYKAIFKKSLEDVVQSECSGDYRKLLSAILKYQS
ncbi:titin homolog [Haliotis rubra]|uniref:titin homolog n=1 Tax=Haliotis rubra TaxID=36100 RepID=UPI001EE51511|nr:titin homolog [Haliotis rubra]